MNENGNGAEPEEAAAPPAMDMPVTDQAPAVPAGQEQLIADIRNQGTFTEMQEEIQELQNRRRWLRANNAQQGKYLEALQITLKDRDAEITALKKQLAQYHKDEAGDVVRARKPRTKL